MQKWRAFARRAAIERDCDSALGDDLEIRRLLVKADVRRNDSGRDTRDRNADALAPECEGKISSGNGALAERLSVVPRHHRLLGRLLEIRAEVTGDADVPAISAARRLEELLARYPECEAELVGGYHTEYSGMKFGVYFLGEYVAMIVMSSLLVTLFLGGWNPGFALPEGALWTAVSVGAFSIKVLVILFIYMWVRWTLPRFRYDQLMRLGWKGLIPLAMANIVITGVVVTLWDAITKGRS